MKDRSYFCKVESLDKLFVEVLFSYLLKVDKNKIMLKKKFKKNVHKQICLKKKDNLTHL